MIEARVMAALSRLLHVSKSSSCDLGDTQLICISSHQREEGRTGQIRLKNPRQSLKIGTKEVWGRQCYFLKSAFSTEQAEISRCRNPLKPLQLLPYQLDVIAQRIKLIGIRQRNADLFGAAFQLPVSYTHLTLPTIYSV